MNKTGCTASIKCVKIEHSQFHSILILTMVTIVVFTDRPFVPMQCGWCGNCLASGCETTMSTMSRMGEGREKRTPSCCRSPKRRLWSCHFGHSLKTVISVSPVSPVPCVPCVPCALCVPCAQSGTTLSTPITIFCIIFLLRFHASCWLWVLNTMMKACFFLFLFMAWTPTLLKSRDTFKVWHCLTSFVALKGIEEFNHSMFLNLSDTSRYGQAVERKWW